MKTLLATVAYPGVDSFVGDFVKSLNAQDDKEFELLVFNDGFDILSVDWNFTSPIFINNVNNLTPQEIRNFILNYAISEKYHCLIFSDIDDFFSKNRVRETKENIKKYGFLINELESVDFQGKTLKKDLLKDLNINCIDFNSIIDGNYIGLSHIAFNIEQIKHIDLVMPSQIIAADWWLASMLLLNGLKGKIIYDINTYYRQSENNFVGFERVINKKILKVGIEVKKTHYYCLWKYLNSIFHSETSKIKEKYDEICLLEKTLEENLVREEYMVFVNKYQKFIYKGWWSDIITLSQWREYEIQFNKN